MTRYRVEHQLGARGEWTDLRAALAEYREAVAAARASGDLQGIRIAADPPPTWQERVDLDRACKAL